MAKFITLATVFILTLGTVDINNSICDNLSSSVLKKEIRETQLRAKIVESAARWLDVREITGHNDHPMITKSMKLCGLSGNKGYPWCASSHSEIFDHAGLNTVISARVVDWFKSNVVWEREWNIQIPKQYLKPAMSLGFYYPKLKRYGHISLLVIASDKRLYCYEGNTSDRGIFDPTTFEMIDMDEDTEREGDGFYPKVHSYDEIDVIADKCLQGKDFINRYDNYLKSVL